MYLTTLSHRKRNMYMSDAMQFDMSYMAKILSMRKEAQRKTVLVLGSRTGSLFRSQHLYETLKQYGEPSFQDLSRIEQFAECYHLLTRKGKGSKKLPNFSLGDIDMILTTAVREVEIADA